MVRYLTADHPAQAEVARKLVANHPILLLQTVMLETEWVLRSMYRFSRSEVGDALRAFAQLRTVSVQEPAQVWQALEWFATGMDFADALHLAIAGASDCDAFATFDRKFAAAARKSKAGKIKAL
ncbi:MAG TPA: type II toxin-antitoxin system VapC family toxin [Rhodanobacteraceae bacterium]